MIGVCDAVAKGVLLVFRTTDNSGGTVGNNFYRSHRNMIDCLRL